MLRQAADGARLRIVNVSAVIYVNSLESMRRFYSHCFGFQTVMSAEDYCVLESDSFSLSLVRVPDEISASIHIETPPRRRTNAPIKLAFQVSNLHDTRAAVNSLAGQIESPETHWTHLGLAHCDGTDPEGNVIQIVSPDPQAPQIDV
jgi:predicted enzyme related to lactoylglutathione lyase